MEWINKETWFFSLSALINEDFNCQNYITSVTDKQIRHGTATMILTRNNRSTKIKTCPSATLSNRNPRWTGFGLNLDLCGEMLVTIHLSHSTAKSWCNSQHFFFLQISKLALVPTQPMDTACTFPRGKATEVCSWPFTSI